MEAPKESSVPWTPEQDGIWTPEYEEWTPEEVADISSILGDPLFDSSVAQWVENRRKATHKRRSMAKSKNWENPEIRSKVISAIILSHSDPEFRRVQSENQSRLWEDPDYRRNQEEKQKRRWEDTEVRQTQGNKSKRVWKDIEYRIAQVARIKRVWDNPELRRTQSDTIKKVHLEHPELRAANRVRTKLLWLNPEFLAKHKLSMENPELRRNMSERAKELMTPERIAYLIQKQRDSWKRKSDALLSDLNKLRQWSKKKRGRNVIASKSLGVSYGTLSLWITGKSIPRSIGTKIREFLDSQPTSQTY